MQLQCALNIIALSYLHSRNHPIAHLIPTQRPFSFLKASRIYRALANRKKKFDVSNRCIFTSNPVAGGTAGVSLMCNTGKIWYSTFTYRNSQDTYCAATEVFHNSFSHTSQFTQYNQAFWQVVTPTNYRYVKDDQFVPIISSAIMICHFHSVS